jgi:pimeloyl-ACP methyl ester carboxylesterase
MESKLHYGYADTELGQVHYREAGAGRPVVLFHESPVSGRIYDSVLPLLGRRVRAIAPDTPGYGASTPPPEPLLIDGYAQRLALFLDALGLDDVALVGNHTGAALAIQLAVDLKDRVKALVVIGSPLFGGEERRIWLEEYLEPFSPDSEGEHLSWLWQRYRRIWGVDTSPDLMDLAATEFLRVGSRYHWAYAAAFKFEADRLLPRVACPTLFLITEGDMLRGKNEASVAMTPGAEERVLDKPWGQLPARDPELFSQEVLSFLENVNYIPN